MFAIAHVSDLPIDSTWYPYLPPSSEDTSEPIGVMALANHI